MNAILNLKLLVLFKNIKLENIASEKYSFLNFLSSLDVFLLKNYSTYNFDPNF